MNKSLFVLVIILFASPLWAADRYVDCSVGSSGNGQSWGTAWKDFDNVVWSEIGAGSTLWIAGRDETCSYAKTITPTTSGSAGSPLTIKIGQDAPYNGTATIDKAWADYYGISLNNISYITISGQVGTGTDPKIKITRTPYSGVSITGTTNNVDIGYIEITGCGDRDTVQGLRVEARANAYVGAFHHSLIHDNMEEQVWLTWSTDQNTAFGSFKFYSNKVYNFQGDAIKMMMSGVDFYDNEIYNRYSAKRDYSDGIQAWGSFTRIYNNKFYNMIRAYDSVQPAAWQASTSYRYGACVSPTGANSTKRYYCLKSAGACTSGESEPAWQTANGAETSDNTCTWNSRMAYANDDGTYWPSHWAANSHIRYNPDTANYATFQYVYIYNNLFVETDAPLCASSNLTGVTYSLGDVNPTSASNLVFANNTMSGIPSYCFGLLMNKSGADTLTTDTVGAIQVKNNIFNNCAKTGFTNQAMLFDRGDGTVTYGSNGDGTDAEVDYNLIYAAAGYGTGVTYTGADGTYADFKAKSGAQDNEYTSNPSLTALWKLPSHTAGISLASLFTADKDGVVRSGWTIGAYEYSSGGSAGRVNFGSGGTITFGSGGTITLGN